MVSLGSNILDGETKDVNEPRDHIQEAYDLIEQVRDSKNWEVTVVKDGKGNPIKNFEWVGKIDPDLWLSFAQSALDIMRQRGCTMHHRFFIKKGIWRDKEYYFAQAIIHRNKWAGPNGTYVDWEDAMQFESTEKARQFIDDTFKEQERD